MKWLKILMLPFVMLGTGLVAMMLAFPGASWRAELHWPAAAFVLLAGVFVCASLLLHAEPPKWTPEQQIENLRTVVHLDWRWLSASPIADALTTRYGALLASNWHTKTVEPVEALRKRLGLDPHEPRAVLANESDAAFMRWLAARLVRVYGENERMDFVLATYRIADKLEQEPRALPPPGLTNPPPPAPSNPSKAADAPDTSGFNAALAQAVAAIRDTESRKEAIALIEGLRR